jgi:hypothetical protein
MKVAFGGGKRNHFELEIEAGYAHNPDRRGSERMKRMPIITDRPTVCP